MADAENEATKNNKGKNDESTMHQRFYRLDANEIDYVKSPHAMAIQNSKYVKIENNRERILR